MQTKEKLTALYKAVAEGTYRAEGNKLYMPDGMWIYAKRELGSSYHDPRRKRLGVLPRLAEASAQRLELLQLGWRASDEGSFKGRPVISTTQPWQIFAWTAVRYGELYIRVALVNLTQEGVSVLVHLRANSWRQR